MDLSIENSVKDLTDIDLAILQLLYAGNNDPLKGQVAFQNEMFLIADYIEEIRELAKFTPHTFGPHSAATENAMGKLKSLGLAKEKYHEYNITPDGIAALSKAKAVFTEEQVEAIRSYKEFLNDLSRDEILLFSYVSYPDLMEESAVYERVMRKRIPIAVSLYRKEKISLEKAGFLAGLPVEIFLDSV